MSRTDVITITPNPALDFTYAVGLVPGQVHRVPAPVVRAAGKGFNVSRAIAANHRASVAIAPVGAAQCESFAAELRAAGVLPELVPVSADTRHALALVDAEADQVTVLNEFGSALTAAESAQLDRRIRDCLARYAPQVVAISGSLPPGTPPELFTELAAHTHAVGARCIIDTSGSALIDAVAAGADLVKPNAEEVRQATGVTDLDSAVRQLLDPSPNPAARALVSLGPDGISLFSKDSDSVITARPPERLRGNPTGAGDAAVAAAAIALADDLDDQLMVRLAVQWSAAAVLAPVAGELGPLPDLSSITVEVT